MDHTADEELDDQWYENPRSTRSTDRVGKEKKRRPRARKNRKPTKPANYMGQRTNKRFDHM